jgi:hypothetical protein
LEEPAASIFKVEEYITWKNKSMDIGKGGKERAAVTCSRRW